MLHKTLEAKATTTDLGEFTAIAAAYSVDRQHERIIKGAFAATIEAWQESGKRIPLHWDHSAAAEDIVGTVDPASMKETDEGLEVKGKLDLDESPVAKDAWRLMKKNAVALSFGFLVREDAKAKDGIRELKDIDLFEITITPAPANPDTRFIDMKNVEAEKAWLDPDAIVLAPEVVIEGTELKGAQEGDLKAVWTTAYINDLPDSHFLYVESGGSKDAEGKTTPRNLRYFPYKDASGAVDLPHLRNALARIPQSNLSQSVKDRLTSKAQSILDKEKRIEDASGEEPARVKPEAQGPLSKGHDRLAFELATADIDMSHAPPKVEKSEPEDDQPSLAELRRQQYDLMLETLIGSELHP